MRLDRRRFIELVGGGALGLALGCGADDSTSGGPQAPDVPVDRGAFPLGVQASDADQTSVRLTVKATPGATLRPPDGDDITVTDDGFVHVDLTGLEPGTEHHYAFYLLDDAGDPVAASPTGRFLTLPADDATPPLTLGASACTHRRWAPWTSLTHLAARKPDLHVLLGDTVYADRAEDLAAYREEWAFSYSSDEYQALRSSTGIYATWDDHEVGNNWRRHPDDDPPQPEGLNRETLVGPSRFSAARQAFTEHVGLRGDRIWRSVRWGRTAELFILDARGRRTYDEAGEPLSMLGREQLDWLKARLASSTAHWKLIVNPIPILSIPEINVALTDGWMGFPDERAEILGHIQGAIPGVVWLSGDYHTFAVGRVDPDPAEPHHEQWDVLIGHGGSIENPVVESIAGNDTEGVRFRAADFRPGACLISVTAPGGEESLTVTYLGNDGSALHEVLLPYPSV